MRKLPTAKEFLESKNLPDALSRNTLYDAMIEFAKLHVESSLKEASENAEIIGFEIPNGLGAVRWDINKMSILNSYPLKNIK